MRRCVGAAAERLQVQARAARAQRNDIGLSIRAFMRLERNRIRTGMNWWEAKTSIVRDAVRAYLAAPPLHPGGNCVTPNQS